MGWSKVWDNVLTVESIAYNLYVKIAISFRQLKTDEQVIFHKLFQKLCIINIIIWSNLRFFFMRRLTRSEDIPRAAWTLVELTDICSYLKAVHFFEVRANIG